MNSLLHSKYLRVLTLVIVVQAVVLVGFVVAGWRAVKAGRAIP